MYMLFITFFTKNQKKLLIEYKLSIYFNITGMDLFFFPIDFLKKMKAERI